MHFASGRMNHKQKYSFIGVVTSIFGFIFIIASLGGFLADDYHLASFLFIIGVLLIYPLYKNNAVLVKYLKIFVIFYIILSIVFSTSTSLNKVFKYFFWISLLIVISIYLIEIKTIRKSFEYIKKRTYKKDYTNIFYAQQKISKTKIDKSTIKYDSSNSKIEMDSFFKSLQNKQKNIPIHYNAGVILGDANYDLFYSFLNDTKESLKILCWRVDEKLLTELLWFLRNKDVRIQIITKNRTNKGYLNEFKKYCTRLNIDLIHRNKIHSKLIIKDDTSLVLGSSNFTGASMSETGHFLDCNIITEYKENINDSINLFKSIYHNKDYTKRIEKSKLMYSRNHNDYLPFSLRPYFEQEKGEVILLFSCNQVDKRIIDRIIQWNSKTPIKIYVSDSWQKSGLSKDNLNSMRWLYETSLNDYKNVSVIPIKNDVHSKLYIFKSQETAFVSSQNLTVESWQSLLEAGILADDKEDFKYLMDSITSFEKSQLTKIEADDLAETDKPEDTFSGLESEKSKSVPWELPEANEEWKIPRTKNQIYFNLVKDGIKEKKEKLLDNFGKRIESSKITKSPILEDLESEYLSKQSITSLYSKPTRFVITGRVSKEKERRDWERKLEYFKEKLELAVSEEDKNKYKNGIEWAEKQLEKYENL